MKTYSAYTILKDGEMSVSNALEEAEEKVLEELLCFLEEVSPDPDSFVKPDDPTDDHCRWRHIDFEGFRVLIKAQYHTRSSGCRVSATVQERWR